jgi:hypothetical protein
VLPLPYRVLGRLAKFSGGAAVSSFVVSADHIDYLVSAAYVFAPDAPGVRDRDPQSLGTFLFRENIATVIGRPWPDDDAADPFDDLPGGIVWEIPQDAELDDYERDEAVEFRGQLRGILESYVHRPVPELDAAQAVSVAACWQYQRGRGGPDHEPESWVIAQTVQDRALGAMANDGFVDPGAVRSFDNMAGREAIPWIWSRPLAPADGHEGPA